MIETTLWNHIRPELNRVGHFQKISDRFTPGVPDVLGCMAPLGFGMALELKEFSGVRRLSVKFRPRQVDWLRDWERAGGKSWIVVSQKQTVFVYSTEFAEQLERGISDGEATRLASLTFTKQRKNTWREFVGQLVGL